MGAWLKVEEGEGVKGCGRADLSLAHVLVVQFGSTAPPTTFRNLRAQLMPHSAAESALFLDKYKGYLYL